MQIGILRRSCDSTAKGHSGDRTGIRGWIGRRTRCLHRGDGSETSRMCSIGDRSVAEALGGMKPSKDADGGWV